MRGRAILSVGLALAVGVILGIGGLCAVVLNQAAPCQCTTPLSGMLLPMVSRSEAGNASVLMPRRRPLSPAMV